MKPKTLHQEVILNATPHEVYEALMDSAQHAAFTGEPATMSRKVGGSISAYSEYVDGKNTKLEEDAVIEQDWRGADWPEGAWSKVKYTLKKEGKGTKLIFDQTGIPDSEYDAIEQGWVDNYWDKLKLYFGEPKSKKK